MTQQHMDDPAEVHVERLLGRRVRDAEGKKIGRLEEFRVEVIDGEACITEFHIGGGAVVERIAAFAAQLPFITLLPFARYEYRLSWRDVDLSDQRRPMVRLRRGELIRVRRD
jgi:sporulation protein YlmC with PRC-barrel domain